MSGVPVIAAPLLDPGAARVALDLPEGMTVAQMVARVLPGLPPELWGRVRVTLVSGARVAAVPTAMWPHTRPRAGVLVLVRVVPGGDSLKSVLSIAISIAATAFGGPLAGLVGITSKVGVALVTTGLAVAGNLLLNALIPPPTPERARSVFSISGWRNEVRPNDPVPFALGRHRYAPPFAATSWTEVEGDTQFVRALFCFGYGPLRISDLRLGDTPLSDYDEVEVEIREGRPGDAPVSLYPQQVLEESAGVDLVRPLPRDDAGEVIAGEPATETPVRRFTANDAAQVRVLIGFPAGLHSVDKKGRLGATTVSFRLRARLDGAGDWGEVATLNITASKREAFIRQHGWALPVRGRWQIEITRLTDESTATTVSDRAILSAIQSIRPEYPVNLDKPLALVALRIRATFQRNGALDSFNAMVEREAPVFVDGDWAPGYGRTPATAFLAALTGPANPWPVSVPEIDMDLIADWHDWCVEKGLKYDRVHDRGESLGEMLAAICAAGRAAPRHDGRRWGVVIDRPQDLVIDHLNPRNSSEFGWQRSYFDPPDALRVRFFDETDGYAEAERVVPWPGHDGPVDLTEALDLPGKTDPHEIWVEARRRMYETIHRADSFTAVQDGAARVATRGDLVMVSHDVLSRSQLAARVKSVSGALVELDTDFGMQAGHDYAIRFRVHGDPEDVIGTSVVRPLVFSAEPSPVVTLAGPGAMPETGDLVHLGEAGIESMALRIRGIEPGEGFSARLSMVASAPQIDALTDAEVPEDWTGRVGAVIDTDPVVPAAPRIVSVATGPARGTETHVITVLLAPGPGSVALLATFRIDHRLSGAETWTEIVSPVADGGAVIDSYGTGDVVELRALTVAMDGTEGPWTPTITVVAGAGDLAIPAPLDAGSVVATGGLGSARITFATSGDPATARIQLYRVPAGDALDRGIHGIGQQSNITLFSTLTHIDGDGTRSNLLVNPGFDAGADGWTIGADWSVSGGKARRDVGGNASVSQPVVLESGAVYRAAVTVSEASAGGVNLRLTGGTAVGAGFTTGTGLRRASLTAVSGNDTFGVLSGINFDGAIDDLVLFAQTPGCVAAGEWDYYLEPLNEDDVPGPVSGPFSVSIL